jgi:molybdenum cofactor cytidylyltransferase
VRNILQAFEENEGHIVIPSCRLRRGHPILIPHQYWDEILQLKAPQTLRDFLNAHAADIVYVEADESVLQDLDTPEDYQRAQRS